MKDYKIKENIVNLRQSIENLKVLCQKLDNSVSELTVKFEIMVEVIGEEMERRREDAETQEEKEG